MARGGKGRKKNKKEGEVAKATEGIEQLTTEDNAGTSQSSSSSAQPTVSQPSVSQPPVSQPPVSQPSVSQPPVSQPPVSQPPESQPPAQPQLAPQTTWGQGRGRGRVHVGQPTPQYVGQSTPQYVGQAIPPHMQQVRGPWPQQQFPPAAQPIQRAQTPHISPQEAQAAQLFPQLAQTPRPSPPRAQTPATRTPTPTLAPSQQATSSPKAGPSKQQASGDHQRQLVKQSGALPPQQMHDMVIPPKIVGGIKAIQGRPIQVLVNYLTLDIGCKKVYRYDIIFSPEKPKKFLPKVLSVFHEKFFPGYFLAFDQTKNFISSKPLKGVNMNDRFVRKVSILDNMNKNMEFEVSIKQTGEVDMSPLFAYMKNGTSMNPPQEAIQCLDIVLKPQNSSFLKAGRSYFTKPLANAVYLGKGMEMWPGIFQSAIFASRPFINIDAAHKGFPRAQEVLEMFQEFRADLNSPLDRQRGLREEIDKFVRGLKVLVRIAGAGNNLRELKCGGLDDPANKIVFKCDDGKGHVQQMDVAKYFATKGVRLKYPHLNCLWFGTKDKRIHYPPELCFIPSEQVLNRRLTEEQISKMVREAATDPNIRRKKIHDGIAAMNYKNNKVLKDFGLTVGDEFVKVDARVLNAPKLKYSNCAQEPRDGVWRSGKFFTPINVDRWVVLVVESDQRTANVEMLVNMFVRKGAQLGMRIVPPVRIMDNVRSQLLQPPMSECRDHKVQLIVVIMPRRNPGAYNKIKAVAEKQVGILTQCVKEATMQRMSEQTAENLLLKINTKLAGVNQVLHEDTMPICLKKAACMIVGADVTHPSPDQTNVPSIAAVTASMDEKCFAYNVTLSIQSPRKEMIDDMDSMMREHLASYFNKMNGYPTKIIYFRDGVSEGQFAQVLQFELTAMQAACVAMDPNYKPEIVFVTVQKRHHTRFFKLDINDKRNVEPGTIVDTTITHPTELDYYLVSHKAIKGTARPTRYHCIANQWKVPHDVLQQLTYYLCHLYSRCSRAVSYPAPTYYAHLACSRARVLTFGETFDNADLERKPRRLRVLENMITNNPMFFV